MVSFHRLPQEIVPLLSSEQSTPNSSEGPSPVQWHMLTESYAAGDSPFSKGQRSVTPNNSIERRSAASPPEKARRHSVDATRSQEMAKLIEHLEPRRYKAEASQSHRSLHKNLYAKSTVSHHWAETAKLSPSRRQYCHLPLRPDTPFQAGFVVISCLILLHDSVMVPYELAFDLEKSRGWRTWEQIMVTFWGLDILRCLFTGFTKNGDVVMDLPTIWLEYLRSWLLPDILVVSVDLFILLSEESRMPSQVAVYMKLLRILRFGRFLRFFKLLRTGLFAQMFDFLEEEFGASFLMMVGLVRIVFTVMWLAHLGSCLFTTLLAASDEGHGWRGSVFSEEQLRDDRYMYSQGLYWAMVSMVSGFSAFNPLTWMEATVSAIAAMFGGLVCSFLTSNFATMLIEYNNARRDVTHRLKNVECYLRQHQVDGALTLHVLKSVNERMHTSRRLAEEDVPDLALLPFEDRQRLRSALFAQYLRAHDLFEAFGNISGSFIRLLVDQVDSVRLIPGTPLFEPGQHMGHAFVVTAGKALYTFLGGGSQEAAEGEVEKMTLGSGQWFCELALWLHWQALGLAEGQEPGEALQLSASDLERILSGERKLRAIVRDYCITLAKTIKGMTNTILSDVAHDTIDHDIVVAAMPLEHRQALSMPVLEYLRGSSGWTLFGSPDKDLLKLQEEVERGECYLSHNQSGGVLRIVRVLALRLFRSSDERMLVELGSWKKGSCKVRIRLPGGKMKSEEGVIDCLRRKLEEELHTLKLGPVADDARVLGTEPSIETSETYGVRSKYVRTIVELVSSEELELGLTWEMEPELPEGHEDFSSRPRDRSLPDLEQPIQVFRINKDTDAEKGDEVSLLMGWMSEDRFAELSSDAKYAEALVLHWMSLIQPTSSKRQSRGLQMQARLE